MAVCSVDLSEAFSVPFLEPMLSKAISAALTQGKTRETPLVAVERWLRRATTANRAALPPKDSSMGADILPTT